MQRTEVERRAVNGSRRSAMDTSVETGDTLVWQRIFTRVPHAMMNLGTRSTLYSRLDPKTSLCNTRRPQKSLHASLGALGTLSSYVPHVLGKILAELLEQFAQRQRRAVASVVAIAIHMQHLSGRSPQMPLEYWDMRRKLQRSTGPTFMPRRLRRPLMMQSVRPVPTMIASYSPSARTSQPATNQREDPTRNPPVAQQDSAAIQAERSSVCHMGTSRSLQIT
eukprot:scaffold143_cov260-Pinguiococcus_pyrenoidosus.AAC.4